MAQTFMQSLAANPTGQSGIYGQPGPPDYTKELDIVNQLKNREVQDFKDKANFMSNLSLQQDRLRRIYGNNSEPNQPDQQQSQPNVVMGQDPNAITGYQKGELGIRQQQLGQEQQKIAQTGKLGEERLGIQTAQEKLNQQKSDQINAQKTADMQRKIDESNQKIDLANRALADKTASAEATLQAHKDLAAAVEERHKLEMDRLQERFDTTSQQHQQTIDNLTAQLKQRGRSKTTTELNPDGTKKIVTTEKGDAADTVQAIGKDGKTYTIPADKMDDTDADGTPHWKPVDASQ